MPKNDLVYVIDNQKPQRTGGSVVVSSSTGGGGGVTETELTNYLRRDGTAAMLGSLDMGNFNITNVALVDGIDLPAHTANPDAHHAKVHTFNGPEHSGLLLWSKIDFTDNSDLADLEFRAHNSLTGIGPNDHHNQVHVITGPDHTATGAAYDLIGLVNPNVLGTHTPSFDPGATIKILMTDSTGMLRIKRLEGGDYVKSLAYVQAATYVQAGTYVTAVNYVDSPVLQYSGNLSITPGINLFLNPTSGYISVGTATGKTIRTPSFVSGFLGNGWQIDQNISASGTNAEFDNLTIRGMMRVYELIIQKIRATNGSLFVSSVGKAATVTLVSGDTYTITTDDDHGFFVNDLIRSQRFTGNVPNPTHRCDMRVTVVNDLKSFTAIRENSSDIPKVGMDFVRLGNTTNSTRMGGLYLSSDDSNAPFMDVFNDVNSWTAWTVGNKVKVRVGRVTGVTSNPDEYGIVAGNNGFGPTSAWIKATNYGVLLNNVPLQFFNGVNQTGYWSSTGVNFWIGLNTSDRRIDWNGSLLTVKGAIIVQAGSSGIGTFSDAGVLATQNNLDGVPEGTTYKRTTANEKTGAGRAYTAIDSANVIITKFDPGATWGANPGAGVAGLLLGSDYMGYWNGAAWKTYMDNAGRFYLNGTGPTNYLSWDGVNLSISGSVSVVGGTGWANFSDVPSRYVVNPTTGTPAGLYISSVNMGYWNGSAWKTWMDNLGNFFFGGSGASSLRWDGSSLAGYDALGVRQWFASAADGKFYAGKGYVVLDSTGETIYRQTWSAIGDPPEPGTGQDPDTSPTAEQTFMFRDTAATWQHYYPYNPGPFYYPGNLLLRMYVSSKHFVPEWHDMGSWIHYLDGVIEMPAINTAGDPSSYVRRLWLKAPYIYMDGPVFMNSSVKMMTGAFRSDGSFFFYNGNSTAYQGIYYGFSLNSSGVYYSDNPQIFLNASTGGSQAIRAASGLFSIDFNHQNRVPSHGIYSLGPVAISTADGATAGYSLDVAGSVRFRSSLAINQHINFSQIAQPAASAATGILYAATDGNLYYIRPSGTPVRLN